MFSRVITLDFISTFIIWVPSPALQLLYSWHNIECKINRILVSVLVQSHSIIFVLLKKLILQPKICDAAAAAVIVGENNDRLS